MLFSLASCLIFYPVRLSGLSFSLPYLLTVFPLLFFYYLPPLSVLLCRDFTTRCISIFCGALNIIDVSQNLFEKNLRQDQQRSMNV